MTNLPNHRVNLVKTFQHTGVDFTGHLWVKNEEGQVVKMHILLFACLNVHAVHIELVPDMSTHQFVFAFTHFTNVYSIPLQLYSDNANSFVAGGEILQKALASDEYRDKFDVFDIWHVKILLYSALADTNCLILSCSLSLLMYKMQ